MTENIDLDHLRQWIGRTTEASDIVTAQLVKGLRATLFQEIGEPKPGDAAPFTAHWCLAQPVFPMSKLGQDGHPDARRLPAAGAAAAPDVGRRRARILRHLRVGDEVTRSSRISDVHRRPAAPACCVSSRSSMTDRRRAASRSASGRTSSIAIDSAHAQAGAPEAAPRRRAGKTAKARWPIRCCCSAIRR